MKLTIRMHWTSKIKKAFNTLRWKVCGEFLIYGKQFVNISYVEGNLEIGIKYKDPFSLVHSPSRSLSLRYTLQIKEMRFIRLRDKRGVET